MLLEYRLNIYRKILNLYRKDIKLYKSGLCFFIGVYGNNELTKSNYPELWKQKPRKSYALDSSYWWKPGSRKPRIRALERAIALCKNNLS
jgi:hypothetical protein